MEEYSTYSDFYNKQNYICNRTILKLLKNEFEYSQHLINP